MDEIIWYLGFASKKYVGGLHSGMIIINWTQGGNC